MKNKFEVLLGLVLVGLVGLALWTEFNPGNSERVTIDSATAGMSDEAKDALVPPLIAPRHSFTFSLDQHPSLQQKILGQPAWELVASLLYILLALYISRLLDYVVNWRLKRWSERNKAPVDRLLLDLLHGPVKVITFVILLNFGLRLSPFLGKGLEVLVALSLTYLGVKCVDLLVGYWKNRVEKGGVDQTFDAMLFPVISKTLKVFLIIVAVLVTSDNLGLEIKSVLASLSIGGLAVGLAAQDTLANVFGAMAIFVDKPFRVGDQIKLENAEGKVESIGLRSTRVRHADGFLITIPNKTMGNAVITNISRRPTIKTEINLGLTYDTSAEKLKRALALLQEIYKSHPLTESVLITFNQFSESALNIQVLHFSRAKTYLEYLASIEELNLTLKKRFDEERIDFAFPSRTVYLKQEGAPAGL